MKIIKYPKPNKKYTTFNIKVKCDMCHARLLVDNFTDIYRHTYIDAELPVDSNIVRTYVTECPCCGSMLFFNDKQISFINNYISYHKIDTSTIPSYGDRNNPLTTAIDKCNKQLENHPKYDFSGVKIIK